MKRATFLVLLSALLAAGLATADVSDAQRREALRHYRDGMKAYRAEKWDDAEREFRTALQLDPLLEAAHYGLGQVFMATKRYPDAVKAFTACREAFHENAKRDLMDQAGAERRLDDQIQTMKESLRAMQTGRVKSPNTQSDMLTMQDQINDLERRRKRGTDGPPPTPTGLSVALGSAHFRNGALADAEREYKAALEVKPALGEALQNLAVVYMLTGRLDEAEQALARAEKAGFAVNPQLKRDLEARKAAK
jgi:tetratricopeptide (TPR) repeat protein